MDFDKPTLKRLRELFVQRDRSLTWYHETGKLVSRLTPKPKPSESKRYRVGITPLVRELLGRNVEPSRRRQCENQLYRARHYFDTFDLSELRSLGRLPPTSAELLLRVRSRAKRKKLAESCNKQKWSFRDLQRAVAAANGQKFSRASRPFKTVEFPDAASALSDITLKSKQWLHQNGCWFGEKSQLTRTNLKRLSGPQAESLRDAYEKLGRVAEEVKKARAVLKPFCGA